MYRIMYGIYSRDADNTAEILNGKPVYAETGIVNEVEPSLNKDALEAIVKSLNDNLPANPNGIQPDEYWVERV